MGGDVDPGVVSDELAARAAAVGDPATRRQVLEHLTATWYRGQSPLDDLVATAPMVEITFAG